MSSVSQTPVRKRLGFGDYFALSMAVVALILAASMRPVAGQIVRAAQSVHLHGPDFGVLAALPTPAKIHLLTALAALVLGAVLMVVRKGRTFHRTAGWAWVALVMVTAGSTVFITSLNHGRWSLLHLFTAWTLIILPLAVIWARRHQVARHRRAMMGLFYGGFAINLAVAFIPGRTLWTMFFG